jgi:hypothetical protein
LPKAPDTRNPSSGNGLAVIIGVLVSQLAATFLVHGANLHLQKEMAAIIAKGYVAVPSAQVVEGLSSWFNAFMGAIFFTVTTGTLLVFVTLAVMRWVQGRKWPLSRQVGILAFLWLVLAIVINSSGLNNGATIYVTAVMVAVVIAAAFLGSASRDTGGRLRRAVILFGPLILLTGLWLTRLDAQLFTNIRDRLLFSNPVGVKVVEFYYDYTLYGAQAMAPLSQHTMLAVDMSTLRGDADYQKLTNALRRWDVLDVGEAAGVSAILTPEGEGIRWQDPSGRTLTVSREDMLARADTVVKQYSTEVDRNGPFRLLTLAGILVGFPVMLYLMVFAVVEKLLSYALGRHAAVVTAVVCLAIGGALFYPLAAAPKAGATAANARTLWQEGSLAGRVSVLKLATEKGMDPLQYPSAGTLADSALLVERYWLARSLASARSEDGFDLLEQMMQDPSPLVICQVSYALGQMGTPRAIPMMLGYVQNGGYWYAQRYAYAALKRLGWTQSPRYQ